MVPTTTTTTNHNDDDNDDDDDYDDDDDDDDDDDVAFGDQKVTKRLLWGFLGTKRGLKGGFGNFWEPKVSKM